MFKGFGVLPEAIKVLPVFGPLDPDPVNASAAFGSVDGVPEVIKATPFPSKPEEDITLP